jgi:hypothetical protein
MSQTVLEELTNQSRQALRMGTAGSAALVGMAEVTPNEPVDSPGCLIFVTPDGTWVGERSREFFGLLGDTHPDCDAPFLRHKELRLHSCLHLSEVSGRHKGAPKECYGGRVALNSNVLLSIRSNSFRITY